MTKLRKTQPEDYSKIVPLLEEFDNASINRKGWEAIFAYAWNKEKSIVGFHLEDQGTIGGYLGGIFSKRFLNGRFENFCNITSWIVREDYRSHSLSLLLELLAIEDHSFTNFTATPDVRQVLGRLGFSELESGFRVICPSIKIFNFFSFSRKVSISGNTEYIRKHLSDESLRVFDDHLATKLKPLLIQEQNGQCLAFYKIVKRRGRIRAAYFLSASEFSILNNQIDHVMRWMLVRHAVLFSIIDERFVTEGRLKKAKYGEMPVSMLYKSERLKPSEIDYLYSEFALL